MLCVHHSVSGGLYVCAEAGWKSASSGLNVWQKFDQSPAIYVSVEHFGEISGEKLLLSGDEEKRESDQEDTSGSVAMTSVKKAAPKAVSIQEPSSRSVNILLIN